MQRCAPHFCLSKKILRSRIFSFLCIRLCCNGKEDRTEETRRVYAFVRVSLAKNEAFRQAAMQRCAPHFCLSKKILRSRIFSFLCIRLCCIGKEDRAEETRRVCVFVRVSLAKNEAFRQAAMQRCAPHFLCDCAGQRMLMKQLNLCDGAPAPCIDLSLRVPPQLRPPKAGKPHPSRCSAATCPTPHY